MALKGIDISEWQQNVNFSKVKQSGIDFCILREGYRKSIDKYFLSNVKKAKQNNLPIHGVYHFCYAIDENEVIEQAKSCIHNIELAGLDKNIIVFFDFEYDTVAKAKKKGVTLGKKQCISFTKTFCDYILTNGYSTGIYSNLDYYKNMYDVETINKYGNFWLAEYNNGKVPSISCLYHQYSASGKVNGINGNVDMNYYYGKNKENKKEDILSDSSVSKIDFTKYYGMISNSGSDERGRASGGSAGDQTRKQWQIRTWYNRPWDCVLRYPDQPVRELIAQLAIEAANNDLIGYDQYQRDTYWQHLKASNYHPSQITIACQADCSAGVIANVKAVGYLKNIPALKNINATYTGNMRSGFKNAGFQILTDSKYLNSYDYLMPGDILLNDVHHTATNLGIGKNIQYNNVKQEEKVTSGINKTPIAVGTVTASALNVRSWAGVENPKIKSWPILYRDNKVDICDTIKDKNGNDWYYIKIANKYYGFVSAAYIKKD